MKNLLIVCAFFLVFVGCSSPKKLSKVPLTEYDKYTKYGVKERSDGFEITVFYSKHQFIPESSIIVAACKSAATAIAYEVAESKGRKIKPINEQRIKVSTGRNGLSGKTSCLAVAIVEWE